MGSGPLPILPSPAAANRTFSAVRQAPPARPRAMPCSPTTICKQVGSDDIMPARCTRVHTDPKG